jgi:uncharacterized protein YwgA
MENVRKKKLINILKLMGITSISQIKESENPEEDDKSFERRLRIQKIMYFIVSKKLDSDLNYSYSVYLRGPYSPDLSKDYFSISENEFENTKNVLDKNPKLEALVEFLNNEDSLWLEIASTLKMLKDSNWADKEAIDRVIEMKHNILNQKNKDPGYVRQVFEDMIDLSL